MRAEAGAVVIGMPWRAEVGQYTGFLHAGVIAALIDTACGYAAATQAGLNLLAAHFSVNCLRPASGERFEAHASVGQGRTQSVLHALRAVRFRGRYQEPGRDGRDAAECSGDVLKLRLVAQEGAAACRTLRALALSSGSDSKTSRECR